MNIIIAILLMSNVETQLELRKNDEYKMIKNTIRVVRLVHGIK
tara:strand:- start:134 stop:262 length:129 start_codon:yes stop_codon:yes gene_type:complete